MDTYSITVEPPPEISLVVEPPPAVSLVALPYVAPSTFSPATDLSFMAGGNVGDLFTKTSNADFATVWAPNGYVFTSVQQLINDTFLTGRKRLPLGETPITDTQVTPNKYGMTIEGHGRGDNINPEHVQFGSVSNVYWNSTATDRPMFRVGTKRSTFRDMQVSGDTWNESVGGRPTAAFLIARGADNNPAGEVHFNDLTILGPLGAAFQFGESMSEAKADVSRITDCDITGDIDKAIYMRNANCIGIRVAGCQIQLDDPDSSVVYAEGGGAVTVRDTEIIKRCNVVTLDPLSTELSTQRGQYHITDCKFDLNALGSTLLNCIADAARSDYIRTSVKFSYCDFAGANSNVPAGAWVGILGGGVTLIFEHCEFAFNMQHADTSGVFKFFEQYTSGNGRKNRLWFLNCMFRGISSLTNPEVIVNLGESIDTLEFVTHRCYREDDRITDRDITLTGTA